MERQLYVLGGIWNRLRPIAEELAERLDVENTAILFLAQDRGEWAEYGDVYTEPFREAGFREFPCVAPDASGAIDVAETTSLIRRAGALFVCGGDPETYSRLFATGEVGEAVRRAYRTGVPYVGLSAGAIIATAGDSSRTRSESTGGKRSSPGLDLLDGWAVAVHQTQRDKRPELRDRMRENGCTRGLAIGDRGVVRFADERLAEIVSGTAWLLEREEDGGDGFREVELLPGAVVS